MDKRESKKGNDRDKGEQVPTNQEVSGVEVLCAFMYSIICLLALWAVIKGV